MIFPVIYCSNGCFKFEYDPIIMFFEKDSKVSISVVPNVPLPLWHSFNVNVPTWIGRLGLRWPVISIQMWFPMKCCCVVGVKGVRKWLGFPGPLETHSVFGNIATYLGLIKIISGDGKSEECDLGAIIKLWNSKGYSDMVKAYRFLWFLITKTNFGWFTNAEKILIFHKLVLIFRNIKFLFNFSATY